MLRTCAACGYSSRGNDPSSSFYQSGDQVICHWCYEDVGEIARCLEKALKRGQLNSPEASAVLRQSQDYLDQTRQVVER